MNIRPQNDYVLVRPIDRSKSSIIEVITSDTDQNSDGAIAEVVAVGPGKFDGNNKTRTPLVLKPGDCVLYGGKGLGCIKFPKIELYGVPHLLLQEADCFLVDDYSRWSKRRKWSRSRLAHLKQGVEPGCIQS